MQASRKKKTKKVKAFSIRPRLLVAALVVAVVAGTGAYLLWPSSAATLNNAYEKQWFQQDGCSLIGRKWDATKAPQCQAACITGVYSVIKGTDGVSRGYCTGWVATSFNTLAEAKACTETYHRFYVREVGCARRADQNDVNNAPQCIGYGVSTAGAYKNYSAGGSPDKCITTIIVPSYYSTSHDAEIFAGINAIRKEKGLRLLKPAGECIMAYARASAKRMARNDDMTHVVSGTLATAASECGGRYAGENIASGMYLTASRTVSAWKASAFHYKNMTNAGFTLAAVVTYKSASGNHYTAAWFLAK